MLDYGSNITSLCHYLVYGEALLDLEAFNSMTGLGLLQEVKVNFSRSAIQDAQALWFRLSHVEQLQSLTLTFCGCPSLRGVGGSHSLSSLKFLRECKLDFSAFMGKSLIQDIGGLGEGLGGMERLEKLSLSFAECVGLTELRGFAELRGLRSLQDCEMDFSKSGLADVKELGAGLSGLAQLQNLFLNFRGCQGLTEIAGLKVLGGLEDLKECRIDFHGTGIETTHAFALGLGYMRELQVLWLDFCACTQLVQVSGFESLQGCTKLVECRLDFRDARVRTVKQLGSGLGSMEQMQKLSLNFAECRALQKLLGLEALCCMVMLRHFSLDCRGTGVEDLTALVYGLGYMDQLKTLQLNFAECGALADISALEVLGGLRMLRECRMDFRGTSIKEAKALGIGLGRVEQLEVLALDFSRCSDFPFAQQLDPITKLTQLKDRQ